MTITALKDSNHFTPPMRDGITPSMAFLPQSNAYSTTFNYLIEKFPHISVEEWQQRFEDDLVCSIRGQILNIDSPYYGGEHIYYYRHLKQETLVPFEHHIVFESDHFIVVDKPHFLTVSPTGQYVQQTLLTRLKKQTDNPNLTPIHRLDRETAGLILISKNKDSRGVYQQMFANKVVHKIYHAIAPFKKEFTFPKEFLAHMQKSDPFYTMQIIDAEPNSHTLIDILEQQQRWAKYQLSPVTGKQHQLRVHMNALGLPLRYDRLYPNIDHSADNFEQPLQLLAKEIYFVDPISKEKYHFISNRQLEF